ncbi:MAG: phage major capsid protein [Syntrophomonadaceae bacterium]|nr:phage major capsid protein [Syntrophomonadaceae bacterium]
MPLNYDAIAALTQKKYIPELVDNFFKSHALLTMLRERAYKPWQGLKIVEPLIYGELSNVKSYDGYDTLSYDQTTPITAAEFDWKHLVAPIIWPKTDEVKNYGSEVQVKNAIQAKVKVAEQSLLKQFSGQLYGDGTGNSGKDLTGLGAMVANSGTYGGIDRSSYAWWNAVVYANGGTARPLNTRLMRKMFLAVSDGPDQPDLIITTDALWNKYAETAEGKLAINSRDGKMLADLGFQVLEFMGKPIVADKDCPAGTMFFLNLDYLKLRYSPIANFAMTRVHQGDDMVAFKQEILWSGNLTCSNCRRQGKITDLDESQY